MPRPRIRTILLALGAGLVALLLIGLVWLALDARRTPGGRPEYVALGSSFAAGAGLGPLQDDSPVACARSVGGYPMHLARLRGLSLVDMSCGGAVTAHILDGGQLFQGPQVRTITAGTRLVTLTVGGNDIGYIGDLSLLAARRDSTVFGWMVRTYWGGPKPVADRDFTGLEATLGATLAAIRERAPDAVIVAATYPPLLPADGTCDAVRLSTEEADLLRAVGDRLAQATRAAAERHGAVVVDMNRIGQGHDACSAHPWVSGWVDAGPAPFHPNSAGAEATARAISEALGA